MRIDARHDGNPFHISLPCYAEDMLPTDLEQILNAAKDSFVRLAGRSVLFTGATGYIGRGWLRAFAHYNQTSARDSAIRVTAVGRSAKQLLLTNTQWKTHLTPLVADLASDSLPALGHHDYVLHAAGSDRGDEASIHRDNVLATQRLVESLDGFKGRFLYLSSGAAVSNTPYGRAKKQAEEIVLKSLGSKASIARVYSVLGGDVPLDRHYAVSHFLRAARDGSDIILEGDGRPVRSYIYLADLISWLQTILTHGEPAHVYAVGSEAGCTLKELATKILELSENPHARIVVRASHSDSGSASVYVPDTSDTRARLGLHEPMNLDECLRRTWLYLKEVP